MRTIRIHDDDSGLAAEIAPDYGGMLTSLTRDGVEILHLNRQLLPLAPMLAGGMPVLFPFPSRTADDTYILNGVRYAMPFHGFVKNAPFAVKKTSALSTTVWIGSGESQIQANYPFSFRLEIQYQIAGTALVAEARVVNLSVDRMPHGLGWHPFFLTSDKTVLRFRHHMRQRFDYVAFVDYQAQPEIDLSQTWDDVFFCPAEYQFSLENPADGYRICCRYDESHPVLVVCTTTHKSVCIEPWCGLPNSANSGRFLQWIEPGQESRHRIEIEIEKL